MPDPSSMDALLTRAEAAQKLTAAGFPISKATLATKASRGGGPAYSRVGIRALYRGGDVLLWATERLGPPRCSMAEHEVARREVG